MYKLENSGQGSRNGPVKIREQFAKYQVNRLQRDSVMESKLEGKRVSVQELKITKQRLTAPASRDPLQALPGMEGSKAEECAWTQGNPETVSPSLLEDLAQSWLGLTTQQKLKFGVLFCLFSLGRSSLCPLMAWVHEPVVHKILARSLTLAVLIGPISFFLTKSQPLQLDVLRSSWSSESELKTLLVSVVGFCGWIYCAVFASHFTSIIQVASLANSQFFILFVWRALHTRQLPKSQDLKWHALAFLGVLLLLFFNPSQMDLPTSQLSIDSASYWTRFWYGNFIALLGGCFAALYYTYSRQLKFNYSVSTFTLASASFSVVFLIFVNLFYSGSVGNLPSHSFAELFTGTNFLKILVATLMNAVLPNYLFGELIKVFDPAVFSFGQALSPCTAAVLSSLLSIQALPGLGQLVVMCCYCPGIFHVRNFLVISEAEAFEVDDAFSVDSDQEQSQQNFLLQEVQHVGRQGKTPTKPDSVQPEPAFVRDTDHLG